MQHLQHAGVKQANDLGDYLGLLDAHHEQIRLLWGILTIRL